MPRWSIGRWTWTLTGRTRTPRAVGASSGRRRLLSGGVVAGGRRARVERRGRSCAPAARCCTAFRFDSRVLASVRVCRLSVCASVRVCPRLGCLRAVSLLFVPRAHPGSTGIGDLFLLFWGYIPPSSYSFIFTSYSLNMCSSAYSGQISDIAPIWCKNAYFEVFD